MKLKKVKKDILLVDSCIDYIEENINYETPVIIKGMCQKVEISRTPMNNRFEKICIDENGISDTISSYINGRKIQLGLLEGDKLRDGRLKFDIQSILILAEKMNCIQKYGFGTVEIDSENYKKYEYELDYERILDFTFKDSLLIYPNISEGYTIEDILKYNKSTIDPCDFRYFYHEEIYTISNISYFRTNRDWLINMLMGDIESKATLLAYMSKYTYDDLSKYKTMLRKTKEYLGEYIYIQSTKEVNPSNDDPMQIIFNAILDIEKGNPQETSLKELYKKYENKGFFKSYEHCKTILRSLLLSGRIYIN